MTGMRLLIALAALIALPAAAQDWRAEWDRIVAAAKKEGEVSIAVGVAPAARQAVERMWPKDYPEIKLKFAVTTASWPTQVKAEREIGKYLWDISMRGGSAGQFAIAEEVLDPLPESLILPDVKDPNTWGGWENAFADRNRNRLLGYGWIVSTSWYNAEFVPPQLVAAQGFKALLEPMFKGKIAAWDPRNPGGAGAYQAMLIYKVHGWDTLKRIMVDQEAVLYPNPQAVAEAFVHGKAYVAIGQNLDTGLDRFKAAGLSFDARPIGNTPETSYVGQGTAAISIVNRPAHPNAAKLYINWFLTKEVQSEVLKAIQHNPRRVDMPMVTRNPRIPGAKYLPLGDESYTKEIEELMGRLREIRP
jgi:iron(III) transport system substrate-binding protein